MVYVKEPSHQKSSLLRFELGSNASAWKATEIYRDTIPGICLEGLWNPLRIQSRYPVSWVSFEPGTTQTQVECSLTLR